MALAALLAPAVLAAGCGGVPGNAVAEVDGNAIEKPRSTTGSVAARTGGQGADAKAPKPPDYTACIAQKRKTTPKPAKGQPKVTDEQLKDQCKQEYDALRDQVLQLLISFEWIEGEAKEQDIKVTDAEVKKTFDKQKKQAFPKDADFAEVPQGLRPDRGGHPARASRLDTALEQDPREGHQGQGQGHRRPDRGLLQQEQGALRAARAARPARRADQGRGQGQAGQAGAPARPVASRRSRRSSRSTRPPRRRAASCPPSPRASRRRRSTTAIFKAKKGELTGPVKTQFGYYVFEVTKVTQGLAADAGAGQGDHQADARVPEPAEGARQVRQVLPQALEGEDGLPRGLPDAGLQATRRRRRRRPTPGAAQQRPPPQGSASRPRATAAAGN